MKVVLSASECTCPLLLFGIEICINVVGTYIVLKVHCCFGYISVSPASNSPSDTLCVGCGLAQFSCFRSPPQSTQTGTICHFILNALKKVPFTCLSSAPCREACSLWPTSLLCSCCNSFAHTLTCIPYILRAQVLIPNARQLSYSYAFFTPLTNQTIPSCQMFSSSALSG